MSTINEEIQKLEVSAVVELYELDTTVIGGEDIYYFHAGTNELIQPVQWQGNTYQPFPVNVTGFEYKGQGTLPRPKMSVSNISGIITTLLMSLDDLLGAKVTRRRTLAKFILEEIDEEFEPDIYFVDRKVTESRDVVEFELASSIDLAGVMVPKRQVIQNICVWKYRSADCGYTGTDYFDKNDNPVASESQDRCGKRLSSCQCRFGEFEPLPFGNFPGAGLSK